MKNFSLIGIAGYIAPRHLQAIKDNDCDLIAAMDPHDSVGILDRYFAKASFFTEFERFDRHLSKLIGRNDKCDFVSICSPNYLHDAHIRFALRIGANAICEKPLVTKPHNLDYLEEIEQQSNSKVYNILQLRVHEKIINLRKKLKAENSKTKKDVVLTYITSRGPWYNYSWKGDLEKSGGVATNIGIHFFDMLIWLFGSVQETELHKLDDTKASGFIELENANVRWFLSTNKEDLPEEAVKNNQPTYRSITIDGEEIEFSGGFTDLHTLVYKDILAGNGYGISDARPSVQLAWDIRHSKVVEKSDKKHSMCE
jgi:UDP-N-acetyl-2-amino-2-deoxyglucuronate dehydrogenase